MNAHEYETERAGNLVAGFAAVGLCILCMLLAFFGAGCAARTKTVTNLPAGVTQAQVQAWDSEVAALHKMATITSTVRQGIIGLEKDGAFPDTVAYVNALRAIAKIDQLELAASVYLQEKPEYFAVPQKEKVRQILNEVGSEIEGLNVQSMINVKNGDSKAKLTAVVADLVAAMNTALALAQ